MLYIILYKKGHGLGLELRLGLKLKVKIEIKIEIRIEFLISLSFFFFLTCFRFIKFKKNILYMYNIKIQNFWRKKKKEI